MRKRYVQIDGVLYEKGTEPAPSGVMVMGDIEPYQSMIDGSMITSRSQHREHLRRHGCVEVGNDAMGVAEKQRKQGIPDVAPQQRHELIRSQVDAMRHRDFKQALKQDADRVKWNSNY